MTTINCVIIDDEPLAVQLLNDYAQKIPELHVLFAGTNVYQLIEILKYNNVDLVFLDIQMPDLTGIELMQLFNEKHNFIITSAYQEYALDTYRFHVVDFLLKPVTFTRFYQGVQKYIQWFTNNEGKQNAEYLLVRADRKHYNIATSSILYIESLKDYIRIHRPNEKIIALENMKDIMERLPQQQFLRIHRSYIIAINSIKLIEGNSIQLINNIELPVGETYRKTVYEQLNIK